MAHFSMRRSSTTNVKHMKTRFEIKLAIFALCASTAMGAEPGFTFKGFSLGMSLDDAEKLIKEKYSTAFGEVTSGQIPDDMSLTFALRGSKATYMIAISAFRFPEDDVVGKLCVVEADSQKKVIAFRFPDRVVDMLFNSGDMPAQDFARQFSTRTSCRN
jgi:hypothetical protein